MHLLSKFEPKFHHLNPNQPSNSLPFLHYELFTEHSFRIQGLCACVTTWIWENFNFHF